MNTLLTSLVEMSKTIAALGKRELATLALLALGAALLQWSPDLGKFTGFIEASPVLFMAGQFALAAGLARVVLRLMFPWMRAHKAWDAALQGNLAAAVVFLAYIATLIIGVWPFIRLQ